MPTSRKGCSELLALSVHEFRSPVTVAGGYLRMLLRGQAGELSERQRQMIEDAERSCGRLADLVGQLSDLATFDGGAVTLQRQAVPLFQLVKEAASNVVEGVDRGVRLEVRADADPLVVGDPHRLKAAFTAIFTATLRDKIEPTVVVAGCGLRSEDGTKLAVVTIGDEASAGAPHAPGRRHAFDELRGGMGLALPIARRVIEGHGGRIWSSGGDRRRATVAVALPIEDKEKTG